MTYRLNLILIHISIKVDTYLYIDQFYTIPILAYLHSKHHYLHFVKVVSPDDY